MASLLLEKRETLKRLKGSCILRMKLNEDLK
jgi:hypothetical protein